MRRPEGRAVDRSRGSAPPSPGLRSPRRSSMPRGQPVARAGAGRHGTRAVTTQSQVSWSAGRARPPPASHGSARFEAGPERAGSNERRAPRSCGPSSRRDRPRRHPGRQAGGSKPVRRLSTRTATRSRPRRLTRLRTHPVLAHLATTGQRGRTPVVGANVAESAHALLRTERLTARRSRASIDMTPYPPEAILDQAVLTSPSRGLRRTRPLQTLWPPPRGAWRL